MALDQNRLFLFAFMATSIFSAAANAQMADFEARNPPFSGIWMHGVGQAIGIGLISDAEMDRRLIELYWPEGGSIPRPSPERIYYRLHGSMNPDIIYGDFLSTVTAAELWQYLDKVNPELGSDLYRRFKAVDVFLNSRSLQFERISRAKQLIVEHHFFDWDWRKNQFKQDLDKVNDASELRAFFEIFTMSDGLLSEMMKGIVNNYHSSAIEGIEVYHRQRRRMDLLNQWVDLGLSELKVSKRMKKEVLSFQKKFNVNVENNFDPIKNRSLNPYLKLSGRAKEIVNQLYGLMPPIGNCASYFDRVYPFQ